MNKNNEGASGESVRIKSTFTTSLLLYRLGAVQTAFSKDSEVLEALGTVVNPALDFLLSQKSSDWTWNYWPRGSKESTELPYPDDLDDTFVALSAITLYRPELLNGEVFTKITQTLIRQEFTPGGPFRTWIATKDMAAPDDLPDVAVNSNILGFLLLHKIRLPKLESWLVDSLSNTNFTSPFYPSTLQPLYFLGRSTKYMDVETNTLLAEKVHAAWQNLIQNTDRIQYFDPARNGIRYGNISDALEVAEEIDAICSHLTTRHGAATKKERLYEDAFLRSIQVPLRRHFTHFSCKENSVWAEKAVEMLCEKNHEEMLLPWHWYADIYGLTSIREVPEKDVRLVRRMCILNLAGWLAYRAYDDILDPNVVPIQKLLLRNHHCMNAFNELLEKSTSHHDPRIAHWVRQRMDTAIEREHLKGKADVLQEKSLGCAIGPIQILLMHTGHGNGRSKKTTRAALRFFRHFLTARQIHDDCHDWQEDLENGFVNLAIQNKETTEIRFWNECFEKAVDKILFHTKKARKALDELCTDGMLKTTIHLEKHLQRAENRARVALTEKRRIDDFRKYANLEKQKYPAKDRVLESA